MQFADVDVNHCSLDTGHRLVLRYRLKHTTPCLPDSAKDHKSDVAMVSSILSSWSANEDITMNGIMCYILDNTYEVSTLSVDCLVGQDQYAVAQLETASKDAGFYVCLANLKRLVYGNGEDGKIEDVIEESLETEYICDLDGTQQITPSGYSFDKEDLVQEDYFEGVTPDEQDYDKYENIIDHTYHRSVSDVRVCRYYLLLNCP